MYRIACSAVALTGLMTLTGCELIKEDPPERTFPFPVISPEIKEQLHGRAVPGLGTIRTARCLYKGAAQYTGGPWHCRVKSTDGRWGFCVVHLDGNEVSEISCRQTKDFPPLR
jgi:hypothetical protein